MTSDGNGLFKIGSSNTVSSIDPSEIVVGSLDDEVSSESNEFGDFGTLKKLFKKSADIRSKFKESIPDDGLQIANYDENTVVNQGTSEWPLPLLTFHYVHGSNIQILRGGRVAKRKESFCEGLAFSSRPIQIDENVCIRFAEVVSNWSGVLRFGVTNVDPETFLGVELPKFACPDLTSKEGYWAKALPERYSVAGSILHFYVNGEGELYYGINGVLKGQFLNGINVYSPLWVIVDIYGNSSSLEFIGFLGQKLLSWSSIEVKNPKEIRLRLGHSGVTRGRIFNRPLSSAVLPTNIATTSSVGNQRHSRSSSNSRLNLPTSKYHVGVQFTPLTFHTVRGKHIALTHGYTVAERHPGEYSCGYVFTSRPLTLNEKIVIQILDVESAYTGSMAFGLTCCDPVNLQGSTLPVDSDDLLERPEYWVGIKDVAAQPGIGDELSFWISEKGEVYFVKNNLVPRVIIHVDTSVKLWAYFDVYGTTQKIRMLGSVKVTTLSHMIARHVSTLPASTRNSRSLLDLSPQTVASAYETRGSTSEICVCPLQVADPSFENPSPFLSKRPQSETGENVNGMVLRPPRHIQRSVHILNPLVTSSRPVLISGENFIDLWEAMDNEIQRNASSITHQPQYLPAPVPFRASPVQISPGRPYSHPPPHPPLPNEVIASSQQKSTEEGEFGDECRICMNAKVNSVIYTCGHMSMCFECATETWHLNGECPICRKKIEDVIKIYKS
ncbi:unnamed protein product [Thelazia callipaeda]|uniref:Neuralized n=1 Tax=Thelazia callipaeda TaxID=103827 RepID=A0A0N5CUR1_THECL|nr:unnamed protein product [Thelazia callipaeda]